VFSFESAFVKESLANMSQADRVGFAIGCASRASSRRDGLLHPATDALRMTALQVACESSVGAIADTTLEALASCSEIDDDDVAAAAYALECAVSGDLFCAFWAAQRAYDQVDAIAQRDLAIVGDDRDCEAAWLGHPAVQAELEAQQRDLLGRVESSSSG
jgi:hypothetical protein